MGQEAQHTPERMTGDEFAEMRRVIDDEHGNPLGTVYLLRMPGGSRECPFVAQDSYHQLERENAELREALNALLTQLDNACATALPPTSFKGARDKARAVLARQP